MQCPICHEIVKDFDEVKGYSHESIGECWYCMSPYIIRDDGNVNELEIG